MARKTTKTELFGKHPLAKAIEPIVEEWSKNNYPAVKGKEITWVTRELFKWWFTDDVHEGEKFHFCQKKAIESIVYCYEILGIPIVRDLFYEFANDLLKEQDNLRKAVEDIDYSRYGIKMATGTGKTWVMNAILIWQYWNKTKLNDPRFSSHFLLCAPGNIVYERLLDSFMGKIISNGKRSSLTSDLSKRLFMPDDWRDEFSLRVFKKEDLQEGSITTEMPFLLITNWHQLMDTTKQRTETKAEALGVEMKSDNISLRVERFMNLLTYNPDLIIINDEAHHVHSASNAEEKKWQESINAIRESIKESNKENLFVQFDFTATPFTVIGNKKKEYFPHIIYDFGLVEAMQNMLVKQIFIEKSNVLTSKIEKLPDNEKLMITAHKEGNEIIDLSEVQKHMIDVGLAKLKKLEQEFVALKIDKRPTMFVMANENEEADEIARHIKKRLNPSWNGDEKSEDIANREVVTLHSNKKDSLSEEDYTKLKTDVFESDKRDNPVRVIVSVLMLREGFDVRNVSVMVVLRRSDSDLLTEQVIGRGIRLMFPEEEYREDKIENYDRIKSKKPLINSYDLLFIVEHPKYNEIYDQLTQAGAIIASGNSIEVSLDSKSVLVSIDESRIKELDFSWPINLGHRTQEDIDFSYFPIEDLKKFPVSFETITPTQIIITDYHPDTKYRNEWELKESDFSYEYFLRSVVNEVIGTKKEFRTWISRYNTEVTEIVDEYLSEHIFGKMIDFNDSKNVDKLRNQELFDFIIKEIRENLMKFFQGKRGKEKIHAEWIKLSEFKDIRVKMEKAIETKKCLYPYVSFHYKGGFERRFAEGVLENDPLVESYVKLDQYIHRFSIPYISHMSGYLVPYYPDFIVKTKDEMLIVETKSEKDAKNDLDVKRKARAAQDYSRELSKIENNPETKQPKVWRYVLIPEDLFKELEGHGLKTMLSKCDSFLFSNVIIGRED